MNWKRAIFRTCGNLIPYRYCPPSGVLFPYGHIANDAVPIHVKHLYTIPSVAKLKSDLDFLLRRYQPLPLAELVNVLRDRASRKPACHFVLSFDDGMRETYEVIAPILRRKGVPAIFFLNSATIDNKQLMWRHKVSLLLERNKQQARRSTSPKLNIYPGERLQTRLRAITYAEESELDSIATFLELDFNDYLCRTKPYLTTDQVLSMARDGFEFGAHSDSHPNFSGLTIEDQKKQISVSVDFIRGLGLPCRSFAFPFTDIGVPVRVFNYMAELDLILSFGTSEARRDLIAFSFQRFALDGENSNSALPDVLKGLSAKSFLRRVSQTEIIARN